MNGGSQRAALPLPRGGRSQLNAWYVGPLMHQRRTKRQIINGLLPFVYWPLALLGVLRVLDWFFVSYIFYEFGTMIFTWLFVVVGLLLAVAQWFVGDKRGVALGALVFTLTVAWSYSESRIYRRNADFGEDAFECYAPYPFSKPFRAAECQRKRQELQRRAARAWTPNS